MSVPIVVALCVLSALCGGAFTTIFFLVRAVNTSDLRATRLENRLDESRRETLDQVSKATLAVERVASDQIKLEEKRIESGRLRRVVVQHQIESSYDELDLEEAVSNVKAELAEAV